MSKEFEEKVLEKLREIDVIKEKLERIDAIEKKLERIDAIEEKLGELDGIKEKLGELDGIKEKVGELDGIKEKVGELDGIKEKVGEIDSIKEKLNKLDDKIERINGSVIIIEDKVNTELPLLYEIYSLNYKFQKKYEKRINSIEKESFYNSNRIANLEITAKEHSKKLKKLIS